MSCEYGNWDWFSIECCYITKTLTCKDTFVKICEIFQALSVLPFTPTVFFTRHFPEQFITIAKFEESVAPALECYHSFIPPVTTTFYNHPILSAPHTITTTFYDHHVLWPPHSITTPYYHHHILWPPHSMTTMFYDHPIPSAPHSISTPFHQNPIHVVTEVHAISIKPWSSFVWSPLPSFGGFPRFSLGHRGSRQTGTEERMHTTLFASSNSTVIEYR